MCLQYMGTIKPSERDPSLLPTVEAVPVADATVTAPRHLDVHLPVRIRLSYVNSPHQSSFRFEAQSTNSYTSINIASSVKYIAVWVESPRGVGLRKSPRLGLFSSLAILCLSAPRCCDFL